MFEIERNHLGLVVLEVEQQIMHLYYLLYELTTTPKYKQSLYHRLLLLPYHQSAFLHLC